MRCDFCGKRKFAMGYWVNDELGEQYNYCRECFPCIIPEPRNEM